jgi:hypothetical protein
MQAAATRKLSELNTEELPEWVAHGLDPLAAIPAWFDDSAMYDA